MGQKRFKTSRELGLTTGISEAEAGIDPIPRVRHVSERVGFARTAIEPSAGF